MAGTHRFDKGLVEEFARILQGGVQNTVAAMIDRIVHGDPVPPDMARVVACIDPPPDIARTAKDFAVKLGDMRRELKVYHADQCKDLDKLADAVDLLWNATDTSTTDTKKADAKFKLLSDPERLEALRRAPQIIATLQQAVNGDQFNRERYSALLGSLQKPLPWSGTIKNMKVTPLDALSYYAGDIEVALDMLIATDGHAAEGDKAGLHAEPIAKSVVDFARDNWQAVHTLAYIDPKQDLPPALAQVITGDQARHDAWKELPHLANGLREIAVIGTLQEHGFHAQAQKLYEKMMAEARTAKRDASTKGLSLAAAAGILMQTEAGLAEMQKLRNTKQDKYDLSSESIGRDLDAAEMLMPRLRQSASVTQLSEMVRPSVMTMDFLLGSAASTPAATAAPKQDTEAKKDRVESLLDAVIGVTAQQMQRRADEEKAQDKHKLRLNLAAWMLTQREESRGHAILQQLLDNMPGPHAAAHAVQGADTWVGDVRPEGKQFQSPGEVAQGIKSNTSPDYKGREDQPPGSPHGMIK